MLKTLGKLSISQSMRRCRIPDTIKSNVWPLFSKFILIEKQNKGSDIIQYLSKKLADDIVRTFSLKKWFSSATLTSDELETLFTKLFTKQYDQNYNVNQVISDFVKEGNTKYISEKKQKNLLPFHCYELNLESHLENFLSSDDFARELLIAMHDITYTYRDSDTISGYRSFIPGETELVVTYFLSAEEIFFNVAKKYWLDSIPEIKAEIQKQENFEQALAEYRSDAKKIRETQEQALIKIENDIRGKQPLTIKNKLGEEKPQDSISLSGSTSSISSFSEQVASTDLSYFVESLVTNEGNYVLEGSQDIYDEAIKNLCELVENITLDSVNAALASQTINITHKAKEVTQQDLHSFKNKVKENGLQVTLLTASKTELEILSILLDQDKNINDSQRDLLGTLIDYNVALKIAGEIDNIVISTKIKSQPSSRSFETISTEHHPGQRDISVC